MPRKIRIYGAKPCLVLGRIGILPHSRIMHHDLGVKWEDPSMSITEIIPALRALSRREKFQLAQILLEDLANEEPLTMFKEGQVYPIYTPEYAPAAAAQLAQLLKEEQTRS
jgi:hypothetical protein